MADLINYVCRTAVRRFGGERDGLFNAAGFSQAWEQVTGLAGGLDGRAVEAMLFGREDVEQLHGGAHYRLRGTETDR